MKTYIRGVLILLFTVGTYAQQGISYKAVIKDGSGNIVSSSSVSVQFIIYEGAALTKNVYQESHTTSTDSNGLIIITISEGATGDDFSLINWGVNDHFLNVQINTGTGLVDMGTTGFKSVPYAILAQKADNVNGLEALDEGNGAGHRFIGRNANNLGNIGLNAVDLSGSPVASTTYGATGEYSVAMNRQTTAQGLFSTAMGLDSKAYGNTSTVMGFNTVTNGYDAVAMGAYTVADAAQSLAIGRYNIGGGNNQNWSLLDPVFEIGIGTGPAARENAVTVLKNGNLGVGTSTPVQKMEVVGKVKIGDDAISPSEGTMRYDQTSSDFEGHDGTDWRVLNNKPHVYVDERDEFGIGSTVRNSETDYGDPIIVPEAGKYMLSVSAYFSSTINEQYAAGSPLIAYDSRGRLKIYINDVDFKLLEVGNGIIDKDDSQIYVSFAPGTASFTAFIDFNQGDEIQLTKNMQAQPAFTPNLIIPDLWRVHLQSFYILKMD